MHGRPIFKDRRDAGRRLGELLARSGPKLRSLVLALPRGGVPVAYEVAGAIGADLDIFVVRKLGLPGQEELAIGAVASGGIRVLNNALIRELQVPAYLIEALTARARIELLGREEQYRRGRVARPVQGRTVILVDDGLATGASMKAAIEALHAQEVKQISVAVPVAAKSIWKELREWVDEVVCLATPASFVAVGTWYEDFSQTTDEEVKQLLTAAEQQAQERNSALLRGNHSNTNPSLG
jgi:putative phosphoribosyl transferase